MLHVLRLTAGNIVEFTSVNREKTDDFHESHRYVGPRTTSNSPFPTPTAILSFTIQTAMNVTNSLPNPPIKMIPSRSTKSVPFNSLPIPQNSPSLRLTTSYISIVSVTIQQYSVKRNQSATNSLYLLPSLRCVGHKNAMMNSYSVWQTVN